MKTSTIVILVLIVGAAGAGVYFATRPTEQKPGDVLTADAKRQTVVEKVPIKVA